MTQNKKTPLIPKRNRISEMDDVRAGINLIPFLLTAQSARPCTWGLKRVSAIRWELVSWKQQRGTWGS